VTSLYIVWETLQSHSCSLRFWIAFFVWKRNLENIEESQLSDLVTKWPSHMLITCWLFDLLICVQACLHCHLGHIDEGCCLLYFFYPAVQLSLYTCKYLFATHISFGSLVYTLFVVSCYMSIVVMWIDKGCVWWP